MDILQQLLAQADHYAATDRQHELYRMDRLIEEYNRVLNSLRSVAATRQKLLAALAAADERLAVDVDVPAAFRGVLR
jgi:chromosome condensin MukBEF ATPase and DNA-binding subunit MukB